jgi:hypothetical protein
VGRTLTLPLVATFLRVKPVISEGPEDVVLGQLFKLGGRVILGHRGLDSGVSMMSIVLARWLLAAATSRHFWARI